MRRFRSLRRAALGGLIVWLGASACGPRGAEDVTVTPSLAVTPRAQQELRALEEAWEASSVPERAELETRLAAFVRRYPNDPGTHRARVLLAWVQLERGQLDEAERSLQPALEAPESATRDHAQLVRAALLTRRGRPVEALGVLEPLHGKLIGQEVTSLYGRERVRAALEARRWRLLVDALTAWLESSAHGQERVRQRAAQSLAQVPSHALLRLLEEQTERRGVKRSAAETFMVRAMTERLTRVALETEDARLARRLLEIAPAWLRASPEGEPLALLAHSGAREARIAGRTLGVVLEEGDALTRRRSAQVVAGIVEALDMGRAERDSAVRLVVRESRGNMVATLSALAGEGASVLVGGVDDLGATTALLFAEERRVPVLALSDPAQKPRERRYGFVVGASTEHEQSLLAKALNERGVQRPFVVGGSGFSCEARPAYPGGPRFPVASWVREGTRGLLILGDASCAREIAREVQSSARGQLTLAYGLEASRLLFDEGPPGALGLSAGVYPGGAEPASSDWYHLLGRDVARLAQAALAVVPEDTDVDGEAVRAHLDRARNALRGARADLETSEHRGFGAEQVLPRRIEVIEAPSAAPGPSTNRGEVP